MQPTDELRDGVRALRALWISLLGGVAAAAGVAVLAAVLTEGPAPLAPPAGRPTFGMAFYAAGIANIAALSWAFVVQHGVVSAIRRLQDPGQRLRVAYASARRAVTPLAAAGLLAIFAAYATGLWVSLAFLIPIFGFAVMFFPGRTRARRWFLVTSR